MRLWPVKIFKHLFIFAENSLVNSSPPRTVLLILPHNTTRTVFHCGTRSPAGPSLCRALHLLLGRRPRAHVPRSAAPPSRRSSRSVPAREPPCAAAARPPPQPSHHVRQRRRARHLQCRTLPICREMTRCCDDF